MSFTTKLLAGMALLVGAAVVLVLLLASGEEREIEELLEEGVRAAERGDAEGVIALLSPNYQRGGQDYGAACDRIRRELKRIEKGMTLQLAGAQIQVREGEAEAHVTVTFRAGAQVVGNLVLRLSLKNESGSWKVTSAEEILR